MKSCWIISIILLMIVSTAYSATVFIDPSSQASPSAGKTNTVSVKVKEVTDLIGFQFELYFDRTAINLVSVEEGDFLKSVDVKTLPFLSTKSGKTVLFEGLNADILSEINNAGAVILANLRVSDKGVDGTGTIFTINFEVIEARESKIDIKNAFDDPKINPVLVNSGPNEIQCDIIGGTITQPPACVKGDVNGDGQIRANDAILTLRISAELMVPDAQQFCAADMNDDGKVRANDAIAILRKIAGLGAPDKTPPIKDIVSVRLEDVYGVAGQNITVPLKADRSDIIAGGDVSIAYDSSVLKVIEVLSDPNLLIAVNTNDLGIIKIAFAGSPVDKLAEIKFDVISDNISPLTIKNLELYGPNLSNLRTKKFDGLFGSWAMPAKETALLQNFPNPFNPETWIPYQLKNDSEVVIKIYSATGELVRELNLGHKSAGIYISQDRSAYWDGKDKFGIPVSSGVYFYAIKTKDYSAVRKLTVLK
ncbi:MAG: cohesin domain-containing protein [Candidatus Poribacteria bacterium]